MNITKEEIAALSASNTREEWNNACDDIKRVRGGAYPPDWWQAVMLSGLAAAAQQRISIREQ